MRMMLKVSMPTEASNAAFKDGSLGTALMGAVERLKPEAAYFFPEDGQRTAYVFDCRMRRRFLSSWSRCFTPSTPASP